MLRFAQALPDPEIVSALRRQLSWSHFKPLIYITDDLKRAFHAEMCRIEGWSTRTLAQKIDGLLRLLHHAHLIEMDGDTFRNPPPAKRAKPGNGRTAPASG